MGQWIVGVISFQKIFGLCGIKGHIVEIRWDVTLEDDTRTDGRNVKIELEFWNRIRNLIYLCICQASSTPFFNGLQPRFSFHFKFSKSSGGTGF